MAFPSLASEAFVFQTMRRSENVFATKICLTSRAKNMKELSIPSGVPGKIVSIAPPDTSLDYPCGDAQKVWNGPPSPPPYPTATPSSNGME